MPNGYYYFQVTDPSGSVLLSNDPISERMVYAFGGIITTYRGSHLTSVGQCTDITVQLYPYEPTPNPGGEYKAWMTPVSSYSPGSGSFGFLPKYSKTDNFKVASLADTDGDGIPDADDSCPTFMILSTLAIDDALALMETFLRSPDIACGRSYK